MKYNIFRITIFLLFSTIAFSQQQKISKEILDSSCECVNKINVNLTNHAKNDSIKSCITQSIISDQAKKILQEMKKSVDTLKLISKDTTINVKSKPFIINTEEGYNEIVEALLKDCVFMRELLMTDNEKLENSVTKNKKALQFHQEGSKYFNNEKYELAVVEFNKALKIDPKFAFAWDDLGLSYRKLKRYGEAIKCYQKSIELDPKGKTPLMNMAVAYQLDNDNKNSIKTYKDYIKIHPEDPEGYYGIARVYRFEKQYEEALESAYKAIEEYDKIKSPYIQDGVNVIREVVGDLKNLKKINIYNNFAEKHGLEKIKE